jgi:hypothetical protein
MQQRARQVAHRAEAVLEHVAEDALGIDHTQPLRPPGEVMGPGFVDRRPLAEQVMDGERGMRKAPVLRRRRRQERERSVVVLRDAEALLVEIRQSGL